MKNIRKCLLYIFVVVLALPFKIYSQKHFYTPVASFYYSYGLNTETVCDYDENKLEKVDITNLADSSVLPSLPEEYNMTDEIYIQVENQKQYGICWSFSSLTTLETYIAKQYHEYYQFSAIHQASAKFIEDNNNNGTVNFHTDSLAGGNVYNFLSYISRQAGPVLEEQMPFENYYSTSNPTTKESQAQTYYTQYRNNFDRLVTVENVKLFANAQQLTTEQLKLNNRNAIKEHLINKSACSANVYMPGTLAYNSTDKTYYLPASYGSSGTTANHMITIIGWDDNYQIPNYSKKGAWLIQNSWGSSYTYFYVSYYDYNIESLVFGIDSATLTSPSQDTMSTVENLSGFSSSSFVLQPQNYRFAIVADVSDYQGQYISGVSTPIYSNSSKTNAYAYYLYFTDNSSYTNITTPESPIATAPTQNSMIGNNTESMYGKSLASVTFDAPQKVTHKYAVFVINIQNMFSFYCLYSSNNSSDITKNTYVQSSLKFQPIDFGSSSINSAIIPLVIKFLPDSTHSDTIGNFFNAIPDNIKLNNDSTTERHNVTFASNTILIPVTSPSAEISNFKVYTQHISNNQLIKTDYTDSFSIESIQNTSDNNVYDICITQNKKLDFQNYILSFMIGNKTYKKMFNVIDAVTYNVSYELNGGTNNILNPDAIATSTSNITLYEPTRSGFKFSGWYFDDSFSTEVGGETGKDDNGNYLKYEIISYKNLTFYAKWELVAPSIDIQPQNITKTYNKSNFVLSVFANHGLGKDKLNYQWYYSNDNGKTFSQKAGATTSQLSVTNVAESGIYKCLISVTNNGVTKQIESDNATVTIKQAEYLNLKWNYSKSFSFDAQQKEVKIVNNYPDDLIISYQDNKKTNAGEYTANATWTNNNPNYKDPTISPLNWEITKAKLVVTIKSFEFETKEGFNSFNTSLCSHNIDGIIFDDYKPNIVYSINSTSNENLKTVSATYTPSNNYDITINDGQVRLIRFSMSAVDKDTTITINRSKGYLIDAKLNVKALTEQDLTAYEQKFLTDKKLSTYNVFSITVDGDTFEDETTISISLAPELKSKNIKVYISTADGLKLINSELVGDNIEFKTAQLGTFVIVEAPEELGLKEILIGIGIILGAGLLICIFIGIVRKKRNNKYSGKSLSSTPH